MALSEQEVLDFKEQIETAKSNVANYTGQYTAVLKQLKETTGTTDIEGAQTRLKQLQRQQLVLDQKIETASALLEEKLT